MARLTLWTCAVLVAATGIAACGGKAPDRPRSESVQLPLTFVENRGQADARVLFHAQGPGHGIALTRSELALTLEPQPGKGVTLGLRFRGAHPRTVAGAERAPGT